MHTSKKQTLEALVTVYIPTHKRPELLKRAVKSVQQQTYTNLEIYIVVDGYCQKSIDLLSNLSKEDGRIIYTINDKAIGACASRNIAIMTAKGKFVTGLDDDDYFEKDRVQNFIHTWAKAGGATAIFTDSKIIKPDNSQTEETDRPQKVYKKYLFYRNYIGSQVFTTKETFVNAGLFDENLKAWQDLDLWIRMLKTDTDYMQKCESSCYIVDTSHDQERISKQGLETISASHEYICRKNNIPDKHKHTMTIIFIHYDKSLATLKATLDMYLKTKDLFATKLMARFMIYHNLGIISAIYRTFRKKP